MLSLGLQRRSQSDVRCCHFIHKAKLLRLGNDTTLPDGDLNRRA
jgi:hypothetical protein